MLKNTVEKLFYESQSKGTGLLAAGFMDLATGETAFINENAPVPMASVYKVFVLAELFRLQKEGKLSLQDKHILQESEKSIGSGTLESAAVGTEFSLMDYVMLMMSISDNTATDYLVGLAGLENVRDHILIPLGLDATKCYFNCIDLLTRYYGVTVEEYREQCKQDTWFDAHMNPFFRCEEKENNQTSPKDMVRFFELLYKGQVVDGESDREMLGIMAQCQTNSRIPAKLPADVTVAHKTGSIDHLANDAGIVYTDKGDYILALFYNGNVGSREEYEASEFSAHGTNLLSELSYDIYQAYCNHKEDSK